jgi:cytochrome c6
MKKIAAIVMLLGLMGTMSFAQTAAETYKSKCQLCHGADGTPPAAMAKSMGIKDMKSDDIQKMSDADLKGAIEKGKGKMPAFAGKLTPAQIDDLVKHIRSLKK